MTSSYDSTLLRKPKSVAELDADCAKFDDLIGYDILKRGNLFLIEDNILIYTASNAVVFENFETNSREFLFGLDEGGISCVAVHPSRLIFYAYFKQLI